MQIDAIILHIMYYMSVMLFPQILTLYHKQTANGQQTLSN